ncbi:MAG: hypothetical protein R6U19_10670 [Bacteroidales bacterium]
MKRIVVCLGIICCFSAYGQEAVSFQEAREQGLMKELDSLYEDGTQLEVFENQNEYFSAWQELLQEFGNFLEENDFNWHEPTAVFQRVYFNEEGQIDYFLYMFRSGNLSDKKKQRFHNLLGEFIRGYRFSLNAGQKFAQCGSVQYQPSEE